MYRPFIAMQCQTKNVSENKQCQVLVLMQHRGKAVLCCTVFAFICTFNTGSDEVWALATPTIISWPVRADSGFFIDVYDWDTISVSRPQSKYGQNLLSVRISLCTGLFPCRLLITGEDGGKLFRMGGGSIYCPGSQGCSYAQVLHCSCRGTHMYVMC